MFQLVDISDTCRVDPDLFNKPMKEAVSESISERYVDKVIDGVGLAIMLYEVYEISEGFVYHGDGGAHVDVTFRLLVFRPFSGELLQGYILESNAERVRLTTQFFDDIFVPRSLLQQPSEYDEAEHVWVWSYGENQLYLDAEDEKGQLQPLLFRVVEVEFNSRDPSKPPMMIKASMKEDGLGLMSWWEEGEDGHDEEEEGEGEEDGEEMEEEEAEKMG
mmetsp:Transcript_8831/g.23928  ORF Transcript_8831/g.23928 Transcript_8831/m.23928 type:complete len:218 (+) Transcript_8831:180-833(+)